MLGLHSEDSENLSFFAYFGDYLWHAFLPVVCLSLFSLAAIAMYSRSSILDVINQDYIRTARAKGLPSGRVIWHHAFRNTLIPLVTLLGLSLPHLLGGAVILEQIFAWPGMGRLFFEALSQHDYDTIMGLTLMFSVLTLLGQLLADVLYAVVDPRVTYQ